MPQVLLLEIGTEELPASFVAAGVEALPTLLKNKLAELRLSHGELRAAGTPRRLAVWADAVADRQPDVDEQVVGPPARVAFDSEGKPTKAALAFAAKIGCGVEALTRVQTDKGEYLGAQHKEAGRPARELLPAALAEICSKVPFRKSMRWSDGDTAFGRPVRWLVGMLGAELLPFRFAGLEAGRTSQGHRFLAPGTIELEDAAGYVSALRERHVLVAPDERRSRMVERLHAAAVEIDGQLIEDSFLVEENLSLVEEPYIVVGGFEDVFLELPERVILDVAKGHQRYFGVRSKDGKLLPKYLAVVNTARSPDNVRRGNDRVMRARLADAKFFFDTDLAVPLAARRPKLDGVMFHKRLGSVGDKVARIEKLAVELGRSLGLPEETLRIAKEGAALSKCDLVSLMVGELPELQGLMGQAYALAQGVSEPVARVISEHYSPRGADDPTAGSPSGALVALADRLDTLVGCFAIGQVPTGAADPLALRRAAIGFLRTLLDQGWDLPLPGAISDAYAGLTGVKLDAPLAETSEKLLGFFKQRLRGVLEQQGLPLDAVDACLAASAERPHDVALRARALGQIAADVRASAGEVFKRASNIAKDAPEGEPVEPSRVVSEVHASEEALFRAFGELRGRVESSQQNRDYARALSAIAELTPVLGKYFDDVLVMAEEPRVRENRLRLMRQIHRTCSSIAHFNMLAG